jgi:hypothetical protein
MKNIIQFIRIFFFGSTAISLIVGCGTQNILTKANTSGVLLEYKFPTKNQNYQQSQKISQVIDAYGQIINIGINQELNFSVKKNSGAGENDKLDLKVNSMEMGINTQGQEIKPDLSGLKDKQFSMTVSKFGKEVDTHEADAIVYAVSQEENSNLGLIFDTMFPDLPGKVVKKGNTWNSNDSISFRDGEKYTILVMGGVSTLTDFAEIDGRKCAKVSSVYDGTMKGKSFAQGMELNIDGKISGSGTWYFDIENGIFIKDNTTGKTVGKIKIPDGEFTLTRNFENTTELQK